jgi:predicted XRE-type DNA-binding protein
LFVQIMRPLYPRSHTARETAPSDRLAEEISMDTLKSQVATAIDEMIRRRNLSARAAAAMASVDAADIQRIRNVDLERFSLDRLIRVLGRLGVRIELALLPPEPFK